MVERGQLGGGRGALREGQGLSGLSRSFRRTWAALLVATAVVVAAPIEGRQAAAQSNPLQQLLQPKPAPQAGADQGAQQTAENAESLTKESVAKRREQVAQDLAQAQAALESAAPAQSGGKPEPLQRQVALLQRIDLTLAQIEAALDRQVALQESLAKAKETLEALQRGVVDEPGPYTFSQLEGLRDQLQALQAQTEQTQKAVQTAREALQQARRTFEEKERARRQAREALESNADPARAVELRSRLRLAQLESEAAKTSVQLRELELRNQELAEELQQVRLQSLGLKRDLLEQRVRLTEQDLDDAFAALRLARDNLQDQLRLAEQNIEFRKAEWSRLKAQLESEGQGDATLAARVEAQRRWLAARTKQRELLARQIDRLSQAEEVWRRRFALSQEQVDKATLLGWAQDARQALDDLEQEERFVRLQLEAARGEIEALKKRVDAAQSQPEARALAEQRRAVEALAAALEQELGSVEALRTLQARLLEEIETRTRRFDLSQALARLWQDVRRVWSYELAVVDDRSITPGKIFTGLLLIFGGVWVSRRITRALGRRIMPRLGVDSGAATAIQTLLFYLLVVTFTLFALRLVNVPLTVFTLLGGALAIGVGFGSQNIVNNFISGLILLAERPIRVGDLVQMGDLFGVVERIGARSTRIRTSQNYEIVVPNSTFLESNVINWTLSDNIVWGSVTVGVAYGSDTREVAKLLKRAADEHGKVLRQPPPLVLFNDFGDNALVFDLWVSTTVRTFRELRIVLSDLRHRINALFREAGIVIAFPQRDLHLDTLKPLEVRLLAEEQSGGAQAVGSTRENEG